MTRTDERCCRNFLPGQMLSICYVFVLSDQGLGFRLLHSSATERRAVCSYDIRGHERVI
jgi:hypothetical protein